MGYSLRPATPARRPLVRKTLQMSYTENVQEMNPSSDSSLILDSCETFTATRLEVVTPELPAECESVCCQKVQYLCRNRPVMVNTSTQTVDVVELDHNYMCMEKTKNAGVQHSSAELGAENISCESDSRFYTGLTLTQLFTLIATLAPFGSHLPFKMKVADQIFAVLVRLRLGLTYEDLAMRLNMSAHLVSDIFNSWLDIMAEHLFQLCCLASQRNYSTDHAIIL
ncbi:hypothetical protein DPMN_051561 [Dreissena polymorpha]|uniref:Transposase Helix-turn-helix domain-containing protein n=1 Tax=Dreissena polymorpha TaxID=45954 RepID=A0A9D4HM90_DREPO|nr:hypothetical protein DPMN_051561 [Dreissena polymorpha]